MPAITVCAKKEAACAASGSTEKSSQNDNAKQ
jgi:hypothetical protein